MKREWLKVVVASFFELIWVTGLAHANNFFEWLITAVAVVISFYLLTSAVKKLPIGTVYAIFAGLGSVGSILVGTWFFGENISWVKIFFMTTLILGIIGLKLIESKNQENSEDFENIEDETEHIIYSNKTKKMVKESKKIEKSEVKAAHKKHKQNKKLSKGQALPINEPNESEQLNLTEEEDSLVTEVELAAETSNNIEIPVELDVENETHQLDEMDTLKLKINDLVKKLETLEIEEVVTEGKEAKQDGMDSVN